MAIARRGEEEAAGGVVAIQAGHAHVHEDELGPLLLGALHRLQPVVGRGHLVPP